MNAQHILNKRGNRVRRLIRRINEFSAAKTREIIAADKANRDPIIGGIMADIKRLENRLRELLQ